MAGLTLYYHPLSSYCWKVLIALYEHGLPFAPLQIDLGDAEEAAMLAQAWPMRLFPVLVDEPNGRTVPESSIIIEYLDGRHAGGFTAIPADPDGALEVRLMDRLFDNFVMTPMARIVADRLRPEGARDATGVAEARATLAKAFSMLEDRLSGRRWAAGEAFSLADCAAMPSLHYAAKLAPLRDSHPGLGAYLDRLEARPSVRRVLEEAAPYAHMFPG